MTRLFDEHQDKRPRQRTGSGGSSSSALDKLLDLQRDAGNQAVQRLVPRTPPGRALAIQRDALSDQIVNGQFKEALEYLNGLPMEHMLDKLETLGFANASYLLGNLGAAAWLGPFALARLEAAIRAIGIRQTGTYPELVIPLLDAINRSGVRQRSDQFAAIRAKVRAPAGGWNSLIQGYFQQTALGPLAGMTVAEDVFRVLDFLSDAETHQVVGAMTQPQLTLLMGANRTADRYTDAERIRRVLDSTWRSRYPKTEPPWPKALTLEGLNVAAMSAVDKLGTAIRWSERYAKEEVEGKLAELITPQSLGMIVGLTILFALLEMGTGGAAGGVMLVLSALLAGPEVITIASDIGAFLSTAVGAKDEPDLDLAARYFAKVAAAIGIDVLSAILLHKVTKPVTPKIQAAARASGRFLKTALESGGQGRLVPALVMGEAGPRFVHAPPEALSVYESTGGGAAKGAGAFEAMTDQALKKAALTDAAAAQVLFERYWKLPKKTLQGKARRGDQTAAHVLEQRLNPNDEALRKAQGSEFRAPHYAQVVIERPQVGEVLRETIRSGNMTDAEAAQGWPESALLTHTEARAVQNPALQAGDTLHIMGQYDPCASCVNRMRLAAQQQRIKIVYTWGRDSRTFLPMTLVR
ncbi:hypothetical protein J5X84_12355 [Streptosporangiaceae bacterium NEAU-GS5]|nr:hypothetical protein [Streptosporangiaceae bacterium NEAU-GS5]